MKIKSAIREMFSGERGTYDKIKLSEDYKESESKMFKEVDALLEKLTKEQQEFFHKAYESICDKSAEYATDHFIEGFKFGLLMGIEVAQQLE